MIKSNKNLTTKNYFIIWVITIIIFSFLIVIFNLFPNLNNNEIFAPILVIILIIDALTGILTFLLGIVSLFLKIIKYKKNKTTKLKIGHIFLNLFLSVVLSIAFFLLMFPFLKKVEGLPFEEKARIGELNMWRIVFFYGFFTGIVVFFTFWKKIFRLTAVFLIIYWLLGSSFVVFISSISSNQELKTTTYSSQIAPNFTGQDLLDAVNKYRKENGLSELTLNKTLCNNLAQRYLDIRAGLKEGIVHKGFDDWYEKYIKPYGYYVEEDFAYGNTPNEIIKAWSGSPGHRLSILDKTLRFTCTYASEGYGVIVLGK